MTTDWQELTALTQGRQIIVERVRLLDQNISIEGEFELPPLARLTTEDQVFVAAFVSSHGSIKRMEQLFGVSYPTIKNRLNRIAGEFDFLKIEPVQSHEEVLAKLERSYKLDAPKGVAGRNSDNTMIQRILSWEPSTALRDGMAKTYEWIEKQYFDRKAGKRTVS